MLHCQGSVCKPLGLLVLYVAQKFSPVERAMNCVWPCRFVSTCSITPETGENASAKFHFKYRDGQTAEKKDDYCTSAVYTTDVYICRACSLSALFSTINP